MVNPIQLAAHTAGVDPFAETLAQRADERGRLSLAELDRDIVADGSWLRRQEGLLWLVVVLWVVVFLIQPTMIARGVMRLAWPNNVQPPFSLTRLDTRIEPREPWYGGNVTVYATAQGRLPEQVNLVEVDDSGHVLQRLPMHRSGGDAFRRVLFDVREPIIVRAEANGARSALVHITPVAKKRMQKDGGAKFSKDSDADAFPSNAGGEAGDEMQGGEQSPWLNVRRMLARLAAQAAALQREAESLANSQKDDAEQNADKLRAGLSDFMKAVMHLNSTLERMDTQGPASDHADAQRVRTMLKALKLIQLSGATGGSLRSIANDGSAQARGEMQSQAEGLRHAAENDAATLNRWVTMLGASGKGESLQNGRLSGGSGTAGQGAAPHASGDYQEQVAEGEDAVAEPDVLMRPVPQAYRDLVSAYFKRISRDQRREKMKQ